MNKFEHEATVSFEGHHLFDDSRQNREKDKVITETGFEMRNWQVRIAQGFLTGRGWAGEISDFSCEF